MIVQDTLHQSKQLSGSSTLQVQQAAEINNCTPWHTELQHGMGSLVPAEYTVLEWRNPFPQSLYLLIFQAHYTTTLLQNNFTGPLKIYYVKSPSETHTK